MKISCILLAAGFSRRMGKPKLALPFRDCTILTNTCAAILEAPFHERVLVSQNEEFPGFHSVKIGAEAEVGMHRSIRRGIEALSECDAICIALADQPFLTSADYTALLAAWGRETGKNLLYPVWQGKRGNPSLLSSVYIPEILAHSDDDRGCHYIFERHPDKVQAWPATSDSFVKDLDDWETYQQCKNS